MNAFDKTPTVVFGNTRFASHCAYCLTHDSAYTIVAFTVDRAYLQGPLHDGLPVLPFEELAASYPPGSVRLCVSLGFGRINGLRRERFESARQQGYEFSSYVSGRASTWPDLQVGQNSMIFTQALVQPFASIGHNVIIGSATIISHHCQVADHAFLSAGVTLGGNCHIGEQAFIGVGAVLRDGLNIAPRSFIGAGAVVVADTEPDGVYVGNPARRVAKTALEASNALKLKPDQR